MPSVLLFITGVLAGVIAGFILSRMFGRRRSGDGAGEMRLLEEQLHLAMHILFALSLVAFSSSQTLAVFCQVFSQGDMLPFSEDWTDYGALT